MEINFQALFVAAVVTLVVGFVWYHPKVFGTAWMKEAGLTKDKLKTGNMLVIFGFTYVFSFFITIAMMFLTIHQTGALGMVGGPSKINEVLPSYTAFMSDYGVAFRTYKHGALHGGLSGALFAFPVIAINGLFERKSWKYIFVHAGYWIITLTIMGAIICGWV